MTELEQQTFAEGFRILLLAVDCNSRCNVLAFRTDLVEAARLVRSSERRV
jgi:hypothetical protein